MKTQARIIKNSYLQLKTDLPLFSEFYHLDQIDTDDTHSHEFFEIGITLNGTGIHHTRSGEHLLDRGEVFLIPIGEYHSIHVPDKWSVQNIYFLPRLIYQNLNTNKYPNPLFNHFLINLLQKDFNFILHLKLSNAAMMDIEALIKVHQSITIANRQLLENFRSNCLLNILMILCESYFEHYPSDPFTTDIRTPKILTILQEHIQLPTTTLIDLIASQLNLSPTTINRIIRRTFNSTLSTLILETKIENSCEYLLSGYSITETAHALGFYDHAHYNKYFVKYFGIAPSDYKEKYTYTQPTCVK